MDPFIEVIGQAALTEKAIEYRADLSVTVRASHGDAALKETIELRDHCIRVLKESGIKGSEFKRAADKRGVLGFGRRNQARRSHIRF